MQHLLCRKAVTDRRHGEFVPGKVYSVFPYVGRRLKDKHRKAFQNVPTDGKRGRPLPLRYKAMQSQDRLLREGLER